MDATMKGRIGLAALAATALALAGCAKSKPDPRPPAPKIDAKDKQVERTIEKAVAKGGPQAVARGMPVSAPVKTADRNALPTAFQGKWGLTAADCDASRGDAKGLLRVNKDKLDFYESIATVTGFTKGKADDVTAHLDFTGEGQHWTTTTRFVLLRGGTGMSRQDLPSPKTYRYERC